MEKNKSPGEILGSFREILEASPIPSAIQAKMTGWLRSSMASLLYHMAERIPNLDEPKGLLAKIAPNNTHQIIGYNAALDDCRSLLKEKADEIIKS